MAKVLICGMTPATAKRYVVVRHEIDLIIDRVNKAGHWLNQLEKARPGDHRKILISMGRSIMNAMANVGTSIRCSGKESVYDFNCR
jgi:uncharacterized protein Yka (UPF0111/DUF47 family)